MISSSAVSESESRGRYGPTALATLLVAVLFLSAAPGAAVGQQQGGATPPARGPSRPPPREDMGPRPKLPPPRVPAPAGPQIRLAPVPREERQELGTFVETFDDPAFTRLRSIHRTGVLGDFANFEPNTSVRWTGALVAPRAGVYHIRAEVTGQFRMWVGRDVVIRCAPGSPDRQKQAQVRLAAGPNIVGGEYTPVDRAARHREVALYWASSESWQPIPREAYRTYPVTSRVLDKKPAQFMP